MKIILLTLLLSTTQPKPQYFFMHTPEGDTVVLDTTSMPNGYYKIEAIQHQGRWHYDGAADTGQWQRDGRQFKSHKQ
jgi:hypothetical protein